MVELIPGIISTFGLAFFWFIGSIPAGMAVKLPPLVAALTAWAAYAAGALIIMLAGAPLRERILRRFCISTEHNSSKLFWKVWDRYGLIGLALLAPVTLGAQAGALIGLALGVPAGRLLAAMMLGASIWCVVMTLAAVLGLAALT